MRARPPARRQCLLLAPVKSVCNLTLFKRPKAPSFFARDEIPPRGTVRRQIPQRDTGDVVGFVLLGKPVSPGRAKGTALVYIDDSGLQPPTRKVAHGRPGESEAEKAFLLDIWLYSHGHPNSPTEG